MCILQPRHGCHPSRQTRAHRQCLLAQLRVQLALHVCHAGIQDDLLLGWEVSLDIRLDAAQQEGPQNGVQLGDHLQQTKHVAD